MISCSQNTYFFLTHNAKLGMKNEKTNINQHVNECLVSNAILGKNFNQMRFSWLLLLGFSPRVIDIDQFTKSSNAQKCIF